MSGLGSSGGVASQKKIEMCTGNILIKKFTQGRRDARVRQSLAFRLTTKNETKLSEPYRQSGRCR